LDSFQSAANWSGAPTYSVPPSIDNGSVGSSHVLNVWSGNSWRARSRRRDQVSCGVRLMAGVWKTLERGSEARPAKVKLQSLKNRAMRDACDE